MKLVYIRDANGFPFAALAINRRDEEARRVAVGISMYHVGSDDKFEKDLGRRIAIGRAERLSPNVNVDEFAFWVDSLAPTTDTLNVLKECLTTVFPVRKKDKHGNFVKDLEGRQIIIQTMLSMRVLKSIQKHIQSIEEMVRAKQDKTTPAVQAVSAAE
jgi:hypothetical protein